LYSYPGLTVEDLRGVIGLKTSVIKRGLWWLKKHGVVEEKNGKLFISRGYVNVLRPVILRTCSTGSAHVLLLDKVIVVFQVRSGKIDYWSMPLKYYEEITRLKDVAENCIPEKVANILKVNVGSAKKLCLLLGLMRECRSSV